MSVEEHEKGWSLRPSYPASQGRVKEHGSFQRLFITEQNITVKLHVHRTEVD